jgi:hypothetical protein
MKNDNGWTFSWTFATRYIPNIVQEIYVGLLWTIQHMKCSSYTWTNIFKFHDYQIYSSFVASKPYKIWD